MIAGSLVTFAGRPTSVVGYVDRIEGTYAICMGLSVRPGHDTGHPPAAMRWLVPLSDLVLLSPVTS